MKNKETPEEAAKSYAKIPLHRDVDSEERYFNDAVREYDAFKDGAKWQQERMYSEAIEFAEWIRIKDFQTASKDNWIGLDMKYYTTEELFEQFKKK